MRKLASFLLAFALAVIPFGGAFAHVKDGDKPGHFIKGTVAVDGNTITAKGVVGSVDTKVKELDGKWRFSLVNQNDKTVDAKVIPTSGKNKSAEVTFKDIAKGVYRVVITFNGNILDKGKTKAVPHSLKFVKSNLMVEEKPQEEPQQPGDDGKDDDDGSKGDDNDGKDNNNSNDDKNGTQQPGGNDNKGTNNGGSNQSGNNGKSSGTISNSGSGGQQATGGKLPKTATSLPLNAMLGGLLTLAGGAILFARRLIG